MVAGTPASLQLLYQQWLVDAENEPTKIRTPFGGGMLRL
jgi:hypothetical protein